MSIHVITGNCWNFIPKALRVRSVFEEITQEELAKLIPGTHPVMTADTLRGVVNEDSVIITVNEGIVSKITFKKEPKVENAAPACPEPDDSDVGYW